MRLSRIYTAQALTVDGVVELEGQASHYLARVLRVSAGDPVTLFNADGRDYMGQVVEVKRQSVKVRILSVRQPGNESPLKISLVQAISRGERMDYSLQKATELGVARIQPVISSRVEVRLDEKRADKRLAHWRAVVVSACEQSGRARVPDVGAPMSLNEWLSGPGTSESLVLDPLARQRLSTYSIQSDAVSVLVGPEGGFSEAEIRQIGSAGVAAVSLGPRVLRTETAGPAAITLLQSMAGDF